MVDDGEEYRAKVYLNPLKSGKAVIRSFVTFINDSDRSVDVYWVNYTGEHIHYSCLKEKGESTKVCDYLEGFKLLVNNL